MAVPTQPVTQKPPRTRITVRALQFCTTVDCDTGRHYPRDRDEVFDVWSDAFNAGWMAKAAPGEQPPALPAAPPETTLPARNQPIPISR